MTATVVIPAQRTPDPAERWELVTRIQGGDMAAFADLYRATRDTVFRFLYRRCSDRQLAEDLTSETYARALRRIGTVRWQGVDPGAWLVTIARNLLADHYKSGRHRYETLGGEVHPETVDSDRRGDPAVVAQRNDDTASLAEAMAVLNPEQRQVIALRFGAGLTVAETARALGKNEGAVKAMQFRACQALRKALAEQGVQSC